jgi:hypothetical protein
MSKSLLLVPQGHNYENSTIHEFISGNRSKCLNLFYFISNSIIQFITNLKI